MPRSGCVALHGVNPNLKKKKTKKKSDENHSHLRYMKIQSEQVKGCEETSIGSNGCFAF